MTPTTDLAALYRAHVAELRERYERALARTGFSAAVIGSGTVLYRFQDDQAYRYAAHPQFLQWAPLQEYPVSAVVVRPGAKPVLVLVRPEDFWHQPPALPAPEIAAEFDVRVLASAQEVAGHLPGDGPGTALLGPPEQWHGVLPSAQRNPESLVNHLHFHRARKTSWEVACIRRANAIAAPGHHAALAAFRNGGTEYEILNAFLTGCAQTEQELPYGAIVALNEHCATLHYQHRDRETHRPRDVHSLLIDAGCSCNGYACDITRTYSYRDDEFARMIGDLDEVQQQLCEVVAPDIAYPDLHRRTHSAVAELLQRWDLVRMAPAEMVATGVTAAFFPHGVGHLLGLQVHDVGGNMADESGTALEPPADFPKLRFLRALEPGHVVTVEPGIYFIDSLLAGLTSGPAAGHVNWDKIDGLRRFGGIRIEDDVLVTETGRENLTRPLLGD